ncbi:MAG: hypothetical protein M1830_000927, partial [Pleopsidium flavum]
MDNSDAARTKAEASEAINTEIGASDGPNRQYNLGMVEYHAASEIWEQFRYFSQAALLSSGNEKQVLHKPRAACVLLMLEDFNAHIRQLSKRITSFSLGGVGQKPAKAQEECTEAQAKRCTVSVIGPALFCPNFDISVPDQPQRDGHLHIPYDKPCALWANIPTGWEEASAHLAEHLERIGSLIMGVLKQGIITCNAATAKASRETPKQANYRTPTPHLQKAYTGAEGRPRDRLTLGSESREAGVLSPDWDGRLELLSGIDGSAADEEYVSRSISNCSSPLEHDTTSDVVSWDLIFGLPDPSPDEQGSKASIPAIDRPNLFPSPRVAPIKMDLLPESSPEASSLESIANDAKIEKYHNHAAKASNHSLDSCGDMRKEGVDLESFTEWHRHLQPDTKAQLRPPAVYNTSNKRKDHNAHDSNPAKEKKRVRIEIDASQYAELSINERMSKPPFNSSSHSDLCLTMPPSGPRISLYEESTSPRQQRDIMPIPHGHPALKIWKELLPSIEPYLGAVLGRRNHGSLDLFALKGVPTVCITCRNPHKVDYSLLGSCLAQSDFPIVVGKGSIRKSPGDDDGGDLLRENWCLPAVNGHYEERPSCGASLGTVSSPWSKTKVSLGGYVMVKYAGSQEWAWHAMTVYHLLDDGDDNDGSDKDEEMADETDGDGNESLNEDRNSIQVFTNGALNCHDLSHRNIQFCSPSTTDFEHLHSRLRVRSSWCRKSDRYSVLDNAHGIDRAIAIFNEADTRFGQALWVSGDAIHENMKMDWMLVDSVPEFRIGFNNSGSVMNYMEASLSAPHSKRWGATEYIDRDDFQELMDSTAYTWQRESFQADLLSRIHGCG